MKFSTDLAAALRRAYDAGHLSMDAVDELTIELDHLGDAPGSTLLLMLLGGIRDEFPLPVEEDPPRGHYTEPSKQHWG